MGCMRNVCMGVWYPMVLVGGDCDEASFWETESAEVAVSEALTVSASVHQNHVQSRLVAVHGVQDHLRHMHKSLNLCRIGKVMYVCVCVCLTWPLSSSRLLVSLRRSNETVCLIHWDPRAGESGWKCTRPGAAISPRPATNHEELWKAYLHTGTSSKERPKYARSQIKTEPTYRRPGFGLQQEVCTVKICYFKFFTTIQF